MEINSSRKAYELLRKVFHPEVEEFWVIALNSQLKVIDQQLLFRGTVDSCLIHPRDIVRFVCKHNSSSFIIAHNHPNGDPRPSREDITITRKLYQLSRLIEVNLNDHVICGENSYFSFADTGFFLKLSQKSSVTAPLRLKT